MIKKYGQIFEKRDVKIFKKIHFARIRAQNEFSFEKKQKNQYMARPHGKAIWQAETGLRLRRETFLGN